MIIVNEGKKQTRYNPYENYIYECRNKRRKVNEN